MSKVAVVYWSGTGHTEAMAQAVAAAAQADVFTAAEFNADKAAQYDAIAFGCPSMGAEQLEDSEFEPMFEAVKASLPGKKVALFGSAGAAANGCALGKATAKPPASPLPPRASSARMSRTTTRLPPARSWAKRSAEN